jgi:AcrR family transcriptional regulator
MAHGQAGLGEDTRSSKERILLSAKHLFAKDGYDNTSTAAIARMAGTSESQLMKHFGSKEGLLEAVFDYGWQQMGYVFRAIEQLHSPAEKMQALLDLLLAGFERDPELKNLMLLEGRRIRKEGHMVMMTRGFLGFVKLVDGLLAQMKASGELKPDLHPQAVRSGLIGMFEALLRDRILAEKMGFPAGYNNEDLRRMYTVVVDAFTVRGGG